MRNTIIILQLFLASLFYAACSEDPGTPEDPVNQEEPQPQPSEGQDPPGTPAKEEVLVFTKTEGYRHASIEAGIAALQEMGEAHRIGMEFTEDASLFTPESLQAYDLVIFLNTTGDILDEQQQQAFEKYIRQGGSFMGIHAASDTEYDWPWYGKLVGTYMDGHPEPQQARLLVVDRDHPATAHLAAEWRRFDEWYNFQPMKSDAVQVVLQIDESSYKGGTDGNPHPMAWYQEFDGGRSFYTALGHTAESYKDEDFRQHLLGGIRYGLRR